MSLCNFHLDQVLVVAISKISFGNSVDLVGFCLDI